jgi:hypothetical protein
VKSNGGRVREPWPVLLSRVLRSCLEEAKFPPLPTLVGLSRPSESATASVTAHLVGGTRFAVLTTLRFFGHGPVGTEAPTPPVDLDPLQGTPDSLGLDPHGSGLPS